MKRILSIFFFALFLSGQIACLFLLVSSSSMEKNVIWMGYSMTRLATIAAILIVMVTGLAFFLIGQFKPSLLARRLAQWETKPDFITALLFSFSACSLLFLCFSPFWLRSLRDVLKTGAASQPGLILLTWLEITLACILITLFLQFQAQIRLWKNWLDTALGLFGTARRLPLSFWMLLVVCAGAFVVLLANSPAYAGKMPQHDSGIFLYFGSRILKGDLPFRDLWDHKPPLIFYIDALGLGLADGSLWGVWLLEVFSLLGTLALLYSLLEKYLNPFALLLALTGTVAGFTFALEGGNLTEEFGLPLQCLCLWLFVRFILEDRRRNLAWAAIGVLLGAALMLKQTLIGVWAALFMVFVYQLVLGRIRFKWGDVFCFLAGLMLFILAWVGYFAWYHSLGSFWDVAFQYNFIYSDITWNDRFQAIQIIFNIVMLRRCAFLLVSQVSWLYYMGRHLLTFNKLPVLLQVALIDFPIEIVLISLSGENYDHYFFTIVPGAMILVGFLWQFLHQKLAFNPTIRGLVFAGLSVFIILGPIQQVISSFTTPVNAPLANVVAYVDNATTEKDYVLFWGDQTLLNYVSNRAAPTRFVHQKPLFRDGYASARLSAEILRDLQNKKPRLIIDTHLVSTPFIQMQGGRCVLPGGPLPDGMDLVFDYICAHYQLVDDLGSKDHWLVYQLRP